MMSIKYGWFEISNGIMFFTYKKGLNLNLKAATELVKKRLEISKGHKYPAVIDTEGVNTIDKSARDYLGSKKSQQGLRAAAFLCKSFYATVLTNFFLNLTSPTRNIPAKIFRDKKKALRWLEKYKS